MGILRFRGGSLITSIKLHFLEEAIIDRKQVIKVCHSRSLQAGIHYRKNVDARLRTSGMTEKVRNL